MSKFSKFFTAIAFAVASAAAVADTYHFNYYYPPGGGVEVWSAPVIEGLRNKGHTVKQEFFKSCHDALTRAKTQENSFVVMSGGDMQDAAGLCPAQKDYPAFKFVTNLASTTHYLCTSPAKTNITLAALTGSQTYKVAMSAGAATLPPWTNLVANSSPKLNIRTIPYEANAAARAAVIAGTDVDMIFIANGVEAVVSAGGKCIAASTAKNHYGLPFLGQFAPSKYTNHYVTIDLWGMSTVSRDTVSGLTEILKSTAFKEFLAKRPSAVHLGLGQ